MISAYASIDDIVRAWAEQNSLTLFSFSASQEVRCVYLSSEAGDCYQISISPPDGVAVNISIGCIEGQKENDPDIMRWVDVSNIKTGLDDALVTVTRLMAPSKRVFQKTRLGSFWSRVLPRIRRKGTEKA